MQRAQRGRDNAALNLAIAVGNALKLPVVALFGLTASYPSAQRRHYRFLLDGLVDARDDLAARGVPLVVRLGSPDEVALRFMKEQRPAALISDENPVRACQAWRRVVADQVQVPFRLVDSDVIVPTSLFPKEEYAARTIRPKIHRVWNEYLRPIPNPSAVVRWPEETAPRGEPIDPDHLLGSLNVGGAGIVPGYLGGTREAMRRLDRFIHDRLPNYATERNEPVPYMTSELSAHLHFGHINPLTIALAVKASDAPAESIDAYLEELIVRRELAINFVARNPDYDRLVGCPNWALQTLNKHRDDPRPRLYSAERLERAETHDPLWNASQKEMMLTGRMHNYLRMYWAKKILEWSPDAATAFEVTLELNDRYEMDGRDPNGYAGVAWAIGGKHDRPWPERPIFGTVRFMSYESTRKKFDSAGYVRWVGEIERGQRRLIQD
jgi:deoxyribodipyrimidine photo-lyase